MGKVEIVKKRAESLCCIVLVNSANDHIFPFPLKRKKLILFTLYHALVKFWNEYYYFYLSEHFECDCEYWKLKKVKFSLLNDLKLTSLK